MMKNLIKTTLILLALLSPTLASAHDFVVNGIYYNINGNEATVTYKGTSSFQYSNEYSGSVVIPETVTYNGFTYLVTSIGNLAFEGCTGLTSIDIPNSVTSIGYEAFRGCTGLSHINMGYSVTEIGGKAFYGCTGLTSIDIPNSVTSIGYDAFYGTAWYNNQPDGLIYVGFVAYEYKGTMQNGTSISLKQGTLAIAENAFSECMGLTSIDIPNSVTYIGGYAFYQCTGLTSIIIPNSVTSIGDGAFRECSGLTSIDIPNSVNYIGNQAFWGCTGLTSIDIPNSVTEIAGFVFYGCTGLTSVSIPNSVIAIGDYAFFECTGMTSIDIPNSVITIGYDAFCECTGLTSISIPNSVTSIFRNAFLNTAWYNSQPDGVVYAGLVAYIYKGDMTSGTNITLKQGTLGIAGNAFSGCTGLTSIDIPNSVITIGEEAFEYCCGLTSIDIPNSVTSIGGGTFCDCTGLTSIDIPNSVTEIGERAFWYCTRLISINIPNSVTSIGDYAFFECTGLTSISIPNSVISIGEGAFQDCNRLSTLIVSGEGEWSGCMLSEKIPLSPKLFIKNRITGIKGMKAPHSDVYCFSVTPPVCDNNSFTHYSGTLHVPAASLAAYFTAPYWCNFANIIGDAIEPTAITINKDSVETQLGEQFELRATVTPTNASSIDITWTSTNTTIATVDNGIVTAMGYGECDIIASCYGMLAICHVIVVEQKTVISLDQQNAMLLPNHMLILTPSASPVMPQGFTVTSSDPTVAAARVMNGKVQVVGVAEGTTTITVGAADGTAIPATCLVTVYTETGDVNMDGFTDIDDVTAMVSYVLGDDVDVFKAGNANLNGDNAIDIDDITALISQILGN